MQTILEVRNLKKYFPIKAGILRRHVGDVKAVDDISFSIKEGQIVGLVGESGSGKSTAGRAAISLIKPTSGELIFLGKNLMELPKKELKKFRTEAQIVFQDPLASLSPRKTILDNIGESLIYHKKVANRQEQIQEVTEILKQVGLPQESLFKYPHEFSGGQQQRISIGRALALKPKLLICDEVVSALDLSVQAQILNLLYDLKKTLSLSILFISHDLSIVKNICDYLLVMYRGKVIERGNTEELFSNPCHPYTQMLFSSIPKKHPKEKRPHFSFGSLSEKVEKGCPFYPRCPVSKGECREKAPPQQEGKSNEHRYFCIHTSKSLATRDVHPV